MVFDCLGRKFLFPNKENFRDRQEQQSGQPSNRSKSYLRYDLFERIKNDGKKEALFFYFRYFQIIILQRLAEPGRRQTLVIVGVVMNRIQKRR